jgi:glycosyltransferase involved in cell wall biosynthesis
MPNEELHSDWLPTAFEPGLVSVIIPTYNRSRYLQEALESLHNQTYRPLEVIVVDDGSTDDSIMSIRTFADRSIETKNFTLRILLQQRQGAQVARNRGVQESQGEYIQFLDSDDLLAPPKISRGVELLASDAMIAYCRTQGVDNTLHPLPGAQFGYQRTPGIDDTVDYVWHTSGPLYKRSALSLLGGWLESISGSQDWEYGARAKLLGIKTVFDDSIGSFVRIHAGERISLEKFGYAYNASAEIAYDHIVCLAKERGALNPALGARFVRLYLSRATEFHEAGFADERDRCLDKALALPTDERALRALTRVCRVLRSRVFLNMVSFVVRSRRELKSRRAHLLAGVRSKSI